MVEEIAQAKYKLGFKEQNLFKKKFIKCICPIIISKRLMIIGTFSLSVIFYTATIPQKKPLNGLMSKHKTEITPIVHIIETINTLKCNVR